MPEMKMRTTGYGGCHAQGRTWEGTEGDEFWKDRNRWKGLNAGQEN
jgi:hypothetical protein